jgi:hypothetical protein
VTEMNVGWPIRLFLCVRRNTLQPIGFDTDIMVYHSELEFWQRFPRDLLGFWKQPRQVCVCVCVCVCVFESVRARCVCVCVCV